MMGTVSGLFARERLEQARRRNLRLFYGGDTGVRPMRALSTIRGGPEAADN
jgi:hypothetical protein